jgi:hypothetical protein
MYVIFMSVKLGLSYEAKPVIEGHSEHGVEHIWAEER